MTLEELNDSEIREQLKNICIVNVTKLNPNRPPHSKILKAYCKDHQTVISIKVRNSLSEELMITTSCNIPPSIQCEIAQILDTKQRVLITLAPKSSKTKSKMQRR